MHAHYEFRDYSVVNQNLFGLMLLIKIVYAIL